MDKWKIALIGYFRVSKILTFEMRPSTQPFLWKWVLFVSGMKNHFHIKGWALNLVLIQRTEGTRKWPIREIKIHVYAKRQPWLCTTWPSFSPYFPFTVYCFYTKISSFMPALSIRIVLDCFYLLIFYSDKFSTDVCRLPYAVNVNLNLSNNSCLTSIFSLWVNLVSYETKREYKRLIFNDKASFHAPLWLWPSMSKASDSLPKRQQQQQFLSVPIWYILPLKHYNSIK